MCIYIRCSVLIELVIMHLVVTFSFISYSFETGGRKRVKGQMCSALYECNKEQNCVKPGPEK